MPEQDGDPESETSLVVPPGERIIQLIERDDDAPKSEPKDKPKDDKPEQPPGWAHELSDRMAALERRIPEPRASSGQDDESDDGMQIVSIEEIVEDVKDAAEDVAQIPEKVGHALFRTWGRRNR